MMVDMPFISPEYRFRLILGIITLFALVFVSWLVYTLFFSGPPQLDAPILAAFEQVAVITSYGQEVETRTVISNRALQIKGFYGVNDPDSAYSSYGTTTLYIPGDPGGHSFSHINLSIGDEVYTKVETTDPSLKKSIQNGPHWWHFKSTAIPSTLEGIVVPGPLQDNLQILSEGGAYLTLTKKYGPVMWGGDSLLRYDFKLSDKIPLAGPLSAIRDRIGSGTVGVWIDPATFAPRHLLFENRPYFSTTTIEDINSLPTLAVPSGA